MDKEYNKDIHHLHDKSYKDLYSKNMTEILREYSKNANHKKYDKTLKIPAIIPIVLYNGDKVWDVPKEFRKIIYNENLFGNGLINFSYDIIKE